MPIDSACERRLAVLVGRARGVPHLDDLVVAHQLAGPVDDADADAQQRERQGEAEGEVHRLEAGERVAVVDDDEGHDEQHREQARSAEERRDLALRALLGSRVDVGRPPGVLRQAGVGDRLLFGDRRDVVVVRVAHASTPLLGCFVERVEWDAIQTANPTQQADADQPGPHALDHRSEAAGSPAAVGGLLVELVEVGDHVALGVGRQVAVGEGVHRLRAGEHRLVDVLGVDAADLGRLAAARHRAAGALEVVAGGAVAQEDLAAPDDRGLARRRALVALEALAVEVGVEVVVDRLGDRGAGAERGDVRRQRGRLLLVEQPRLPRRLRARLLQRHPAGADLEVDRGGADVGQRRTEVVAVLGEDALAGLAVAERAAHQEELAALLDQLLVALGLAGLGGRERGVEAAGEQQAEQQDHESGETSAPVPRESTGGAVQKTHILSLRVELVGYLIR